jgi:hypothetical protein
VPGVNAGYITRSKLLGDHLRQQQEIISRKMIDAVQGRPNGKGQQSATWPMIAARVALQRLLEETERGGTTDQTMADETGDDGDDRKQGRTGFARRDASRRELPELRSTATDAAGSC